MVLGRESGAMPASNNHNRSGASHAEEGRRLEGRLPEVQEFLPLTREFAGKLTGNSDPRTVDHKIPLDRGGSGTAMKNLRIASATANRRKYNN